MLTKTAAWTRLSSSDTVRGPALMALYGAGEAGKTRLVASAIRACPDWFGKRAAYLAIDPESELLGSVPREDRSNMERILIDQNKDVYAQISDIYAFDWRAEGITTIITDTMTTLSQTMHAQLTNSGKFSDRHIQLAPGVNQPMQGDFLATNTLIMTLLRKQQASRLNHLTLFHEQEVRPEPGSPGEPVGGPATVGKASVRSIVNWYNTVLHVVKQQKKRTNPTQPIEYEHVVYTSGHGIWQAKLRVPTPTNPIPCIPMGTDPSNVWRELYNLEQENSR